MPWLPGLKLRKQNNVADAFLAQQHHAKAIQAIPEARLRAFHSHSQPKAEKMARQFGVESESNLDRFLERPDTRGTSRLLPHARAGGFAIDA